MENIKKLKKKKHLFVFILLFIFFLILTFNLLAYIYPSREYIKKLVEIKPSSLEDIGYSYSNIPEEELSKSLYNDINYNSIKSNSHIKETGTEKMFILRFKIPESYIHNISDKKLIIYLDNVYVSNGTLYAPVLTQETSHPSYIQVSLSHNNVGSYFSLPESILKNEYFYMLLPNENMCFHVILDELNSFLSQQNIELLYFHGHIGLLLGILICNILLYSSTKDKKYILHVLFLYCLTQYFLFSNGTYEMIFNNVYMGWIGAWSYALFLSLLIFIYFTLEINLKGKAAKYIFKGTIFIGFACMVFSFLAENLFLMNFSRYYGISAIVLCLITSIYYYVKYKCFSIYYMIAQLIFAITGLINALSKVDLIHANFFITNIVYSAASIEAILLTLGITNKLEEEQLKNKQLLILSTTDELTELKNRHYFDIIYPSLENESERYKKPMSMILFDLDHFKKINDTYGHDVGDTVLQRTAELIKTTARKSDIAIRWGGEEFIILLPQTNLDGAIILAEKLRTSIEEDSFYDLCKVTASFGVSQKDYDENFDHWYSKIDSALYKAKSQGRNKVVPYLLSLYGKDDFLSFRLKWSEEFECGISLIDTQHKVMFDMIDKLLLSFQLENNLKNTLNEYEEFLNHVVKHFKDEEIIMKKLKYENYENHKQIHNDLVKSALEFENKFINGEGTFQMLYKFVYGEVVMGHLISEDFGYFKYSRTANKDLFKEI